MEYSRRARFLETFSGDGKRHRSSFQPLDSRIVFTVALGSATLFASNPKWRDMDLITSIAKTGVASTIGSTAAQVDQQIISLAMHVRLAGKSVREITAPFVNLKGLGGTAEEPAGYGFSVYFSNSYWVVDVSAAIPDGIFAKLTFSYPAETPLSEIAQVLKQQETALWDTLGVEVE